MKINPVLIALTIFPMFFSGCMTTKGFAVQGFDWDKSAPGVEERSTKVIIDNEFIYADHHLTPHITLYSYLLIENRSKDKKVTILKANFDYYFKGEKLINVDKRVKDYYRNIDLPYTLNTRKHLWDDDYIVVFSYMSDKKVKDFNERDVVKVVIVIEYEVDGKRYEVDREFNIICIIINLPFEMM